MASTTRHSSCSEYSIFGSDKQMCETELPTIGDVIRPYNFEWQTQRRNDNGNKPDYSAIAKITLDKVKLLWQRASIPVVSDLTMNDLFKKHMNANKKKSYKRDQNKDGFKKRVSDFVEKSNTLFDICFCKCVDLNACICALEKKSQAWNMSF